MSKWDDSSAMVWFKFTLFIIAIILSIGNALRADDWEDSDSEIITPSKKIYLIKDISTGSGIQPYFMYQSGDLLFYRNLQTGEGFKTCWIN